MGGLSFEKIMVILVIAMFVLGPERIPVYAKRLGELVRTVKRMGNEAKDRLRDEMGPEFDEVDWKQLDPRQYDPRRIIRDALLEDERDARTAVGVGAGAATVASGSVASSEESASSGAAGRATGEQLHDDGTVRFDDEAT